MRKSSQKTKAQDRAVAIRYDPNNCATPRLVAKGKGLVAAKIREAAALHNIPMHRDDDLVEMLSAVELNREIPPELYVSVAELLSWIYKANNSFKKE